MSLVGFKLLVMVFSVPVISQNVVITPNWNQSTVTDIPPSPFNTNMFDTTISNLTSSGYQNTIKTLNSKFIRIHNAFLTLDSSQNVYGLTTIENNTLVWDSVKLTQLANAIKDLRSSGYAPEIMFNIPDLPTYFDPFANPQMYGDFMGDLVFQLNVVHGLDIGYFEITNERDDDFDKGVGCSSYAYCERTFSEFISLYNIAASAMKQVDPTIKTGGLSYQNPFANVDEFLQLVDPQNLDFLSVHRYEGFGNPVKPVEDVLARPKTLVYDLTNQLRQKLTQNSIDAEIFINEYNICFVYDCGFNQNPNGSNDYMAGQVGAVFDALGFVYAMQSKLDGLFTWNEKDDFYGKISSQYQLRPSAYVHGLFNDYEFSHLVDQNIQGQTNEDVISQPFVLKNGKFGVILINKTESTKAVSVDSLNGHVYDSSRVYSNQILQSQGLVSGQYTTTLQPLEVQIATFYNQSSTLDISLKLSGVSNSGVLLHDRNILPFYSPYDRFITREVDSNLVDWVTVTFDNAQNQRIYSTDVIVTKQQKLRTKNDGLITLYNDFVQNPMFITIQHRNHIPLSATQSFVLSPFVTLDFTQGVLGTASVQQVTSGGDYGMIYGDITGDGVIDSADRNAIKITSESDGVYSNLDVNLDGSVDAQDRAMMRNQQEFGS